MSKSKTTLTDHTFLDGEQLFDTWRLEITCARADQLTPRPQNILGLPRYLQRPDGKTLFQAARLRPDDRIALLSDPYMVKWARDRGLGLPKAGGEMALAFFGDARYRLRRMHDISMAMHAYTSVLAAGRFSLDMNVLAGLFTQSANDITFDQRWQWEQKCIEMHNDPGMTQCIVHLNLQFNRFSVAGALVLYEIGGMLPKWYSLSSHERKRAILGLVLLVTLSLSLAPIIWASERVPELAREFADLRPVYPHLGPRTRVPSRQQRSKVLHLWRRQLEAVHQRLDRLKSRMPSLQHIPQLRGLTQSLSVIHRARKRHRRLRAVVDLVVDSTH